MSFLFRIFQYILISTGLLYVLVHSQVFSPATYAVSTLPYTDISTTDSDRTYIQTLYTAGILVDTPDHLFRPDEYISREAFTALAVGVGCHRCMPPTGTDFLAYTPSASTTVPFVDISVSSPYYYCVAYAADKDIVKGYILGPTGTTTCGSGPVYTTVPFCPADTTSRIEAAAILLRQAGIWDDTKNISRVRTTEIVDVSDYWYGYAKKAVDSGLLTLDNKKISPDTPVSRREFVRMAARTYQINQCNLTAGDDSNQYIQIRIYGQGGVGTTPVYTMPTASSGAVRTLDLAADPSVSTLRYVWTITSLDDRSVRTYTGMYLDDITFGSSAYSVVLVSTDISTGLSGTATAYIASTASTITTVGTGYGTGGIYVSPFPPTVDTALTFSTAYTGGYLPYTYSWTFGDSTSSTLQNPVHTYTAPGTYIVILVITDARGTSTTSTYTVVIPAPAVSGVGISSSISASPLSGISGQATTFTATTSGGNGTYSYLWSFGDGTTSTAVSPTYTYTSIGYHTVTLVTTDTAGHSAYTSLVVYTGTDPDPDRDGIYTYTGTGIGNSTISTGGISISPFPPTVGTALIFSTSYTGGYLPYTYSWTFGDGTSSTLQNPVHTYTAPGTYLVTLVVTDARGTSTTSTYTVVIPAPSDLCPYVAGDRAYSGCPYISTYTSGATLLDMLSARNTCIGGLARTQGVVVGTPTCNTCPCNTTVDILATLRACDILTPTILSPSATSVYSRGNGLQIQ